MLQNARDTYLETQINTASPQRLRLMLIDGAIRFSAQAAKSLEDENFEAASEALDRARAIITELLINLSPDSTPLAGNIAEIYLFLFRTLTEAQFERNVSKLKEVILILHEERETWRLICDKMPDAPTSAPSQEKEITAADWEAQTAKAQTPTDASAQSPAEQEALPSEAPADSAIPPIDPSPMPQSQFSLDA